MSQDNQQDAQFECTACHIKHTKEDAENAMTACRLCGRLHCQDCVDEYGRCVACAGKAPSGG
jgi:Prokaryotic RING finger family 2